MSEANEPQLAIGILDFKRESEARRLLDSLDEYLKVKADIIYCHDGPPPDYVMEFLREGRIHTLLTSSANQGCGIQTRRLFQAALPYPLFAYVQVDQYLVRPFDHQAFWGCAQMLMNAETFYVDLAGNQGRGNPSERALVMSPSKYLRIPGIHEVRGGPGPFASEKWTEQHLQEYMKGNSLKFATATPLYFADNGKWSRRAFSCGGETLHATDTKILMITKPLKQRYDFPNLKLSDSEWLEVLEGRWPVEGKIPEADKPHSFVVEGWK
jgi:hypothetical protein